MDPVHQPPRLPDDVIILIIEQACMRCHPRIVLTFMKTSKFFRRTVIKLLGGYPILRAPVVIPRLQGSSDGERNIVSGIMIGGASPLYTTATARTPTAPHYTTVTNRTLTAPLAATIGNVAISSSTLIGYGVNTVLCNTPNAIILNDGTGRVIEAASAPAAASESRDLHVLIGGGNGNMPGAPKPDDDLPWWVHPERHYVIVCDSDVCAIHYSGGLHIIMDMAMHKYKYRASAQRTIDSTYQRLAPCRKFCYGEMHICDHSTVKIVSCADVMKRFHVQPERIISLNKLDMTQRYGIKNVELTSWMEYAYNFSQVLDSIFHWYPIAQDDVINELDSCIKFQSGLVGDYTETRIYDMYSIACAHVLLRMRFVRDCLMHSGNNRQLMRLQRYIVLCKQLENPINAVYSGSDHKGFTPSPCYAG